MRTYLKAIIVCALTIVFLYGCNSKETLTLERANKSLNVFLPGAVANGVAASRVLDMYEVTLVYQGRTGIVYMDGAGKFVFAGNIIDVATNTNLTQERLTDLSRVDFSKIPLENSFIIGNGTSATRKAVVFVSPSCGICGLLHQHMEELAGRRKDLAFYLKVLPQLSKYQETYETSRTLACAFGKDKGKALGMLKQAYRISLPEKPDCKTDIIDRNLEMSSKLQATSTPTIIFDDGTKLLNAYIRSAKELEDMIEKRKPRK